MNRKTTGATVVIAVLALAGLWWFVGLGPREEANVVEPAREAPIVFDDDTQLPDAKPASAASGEARVAFEPRGTVESPAPAQPDADAAEAVESPRVFWCRVVHAESGAPLAKVPITPGDLHRRSRDRDCNKRSCDVRGPVITDDEGVADLSELAEHWRGFRVEAPGFGLVLGGAPDIDVPRSTPLEIRLSEAAALRLDLVSGGAPLSDARVELEARASWVSQPRGGGTGSLETPVFEGTTDSDGVVELSDLPAGVPFDARVSVGGRVVLRKPGGVLLDPGERRVETWTVGDGARVVALLSDQGGAPIADQRLWILTKPRNAHRSDGKVYLANADRSGLVSEAVTDALGRCEFEDVRPGSYYLGVAPAPHGASDEELGEIAPVAIPVEVAAGSNEARLTAARGLFIEGRVRCPDGESVRLLQLLASSKYGILQLTGRGGDFRLGPLEPVAHRMRASGSNGFGPSDVVSADPGDEVELLLSDAPFGKLALTFVDARTGAPCEARTSVTSLEEGGRTMRPALLSSVSFGELRPGPYHVWATTADGRFGVLPSVEVPGGPRGAPPTERVVRMEPGAELVVTVVGEASSGACAVLVDGLRLELRGLRPGLELRLVVPPREITVELRVDGEVVETREVHGLVGESHEVVFRDE